MELETKMLPLLEGINMLIGGYLYNDGEIEDVPQFLEEMAKMFRQKIKEQKKT